ncbi:protein disulfide isomerase Creld1 isoform X2 [Latimeria chalumnae]|uniref:protein disulfide isomerase Creld1 isoform X2 n=1 Tax=Latimeria chalumnae TaxID=7897 RepID=UPI00313E15E8
MEVYLVFPQWRVLLFFPLLISAFLMLLLDSTSATTNPCETCRKLANNFRKGLEKTANQNFGGGNTAWEEEKLAKYKISETRLVEIMEMLCESSSFECNKMVEQHEEQLERWWFNKQREHPDLLQWLCIDTIKVCCPPGTFGPDCTECTGGSEQPCSGKGTCDGDGTRSGTGLCNCNASYGGPLCTECAEGYYRQSKNESHLVCSECYKSCSKCSGPEDFKCLQCKKGWLLHDHKCVDIDECGTEMAQCLPSQFCVNKDGSYECRACDKACIGCMGAGPSRCKKCSKGYKMDGAKCLDIDECSSEEPVCKGENEACKNSDGGYSCVCDEGYVRRDGVCVEEEPAESKKGLFDDITDDEVIVLQQMFFGVIICALATLAAKGDMVFTAIFIGAVASMAGVKYLCSRLAHGFYLFDFSGCGGIHFGTAIPSPRTRLLFTSTEELQYPEACSGAI